MPNDDVVLSLKSLNEIMAELPEAPEGAEKRKNVLTKDDVMIIARIVQAVSHTSCAMGLTEEEIGTVKRLVSGLNKSILVIGYAILTAIGAGIVSIGLWAIKHGIVEVAQKGGK